MTPIAPHITAFLRKRLAVDQRASPHTCDTYAYAFQLLFEFMSRKLGVAPADLQLEQIDAPLVLEFLGHLQNDRHNSPRTRNARLAAIRSFMRFIEHRVPSALDQLRRPDGQISPFLQVAHDPARSHVAPPGAPSHFSSWMGPLARVSRADRGHRWRSTAWRLRTLPWSRHIAMSTRSAASSS